MEGISVFATKTVIIVKNEDACGKIWCLRLYVDVSWWSYWQKVQRPSIFLGFDANEALLLFL